VNDGFFLQEMANNGRIMPHGRIMPR